MNTKQGDVDQLLGDRSPRSMKFTNFSLTVPHFL